MRTLGLWLCIILAALPGVITAQEATETPSPPPALTQYAGEPADAVAELQNLELVGAGGRLLFRENDVFLNGNGYVALAVRAPATDIMMAGEITLATVASENTQVCSLSSRIDREYNRAITYLNVGLTSQGDLLIADVLTKNAAPTTLVTVELGLDMTEPHHILAVTVNEALTVFVDGEQVAQDVQVSVRRGTHGVLTQEMVPGSRCEVRNLWVYEIPPPDTGVCTVRSLRNINRRSGPGTGFAAEGRMTNGEQAVVQGRATGSDGQTWWQLEDGSWVRDDVVDAVGGCASVPVVEP